MSQSIIWPSQLGAAPLASDNEECKRELTFFPHREWISGREAGKFSQVKKRQKSLPCEKRGDREGKTVRRDGVGSDGRRKRNLKGRQ